MEMEASALTNTAAARAAKRLEVQRAMDEVHEPPAGMVSGPDVRNLQKLICLLVCSQHL